MMQKMSEHPLDVAAGKIMQLVNDRINEEAPGWSRYEMEDRVEQLAREVIPEGWQWTLLISTGRPPQIVLTQFREPWHDTSH